MYLCWRKRRGFSRELVFKEEIDRKLCAFGNYWLVLKGTIFRLSGITAYSSFQKSSHCTEVSKLDWHKMLDPLDLFSEKMIGNVEEKNGLYFLFSPTSHRSLNLVSMSHYDVMLLHKR
ncbi:uncharacterized protein LOC127805981 isoform X4 [Diospyros lotus]|uniref:uncharacterized protein LOC127805981 isoform X4 n=1 Tax=Diospyros lotus TaxID=55363 RepID=UPI002253B6B8|nr:uncharacterized protein LOC127805981 isoform X4 [Diospyros lotus]